MARTSKQRPLRPRVAIVGDGMTEKIYFSDVKDTDRPSDLDLFPDLPSKSGSYSNVLGKAIQLAEAYTKVFAFIDMDTVINDHLEQAYSVAKAEAKHHGVIVLENYPCFEIWPLLHFKPTSRPFVSCGEVSDELKREGRIPTYEKTQKFLVAAKLYSNYKSRILTHAIPAAKLLEKDRDQKSNRHPRAEIFRFFEWYFAEDRLQRLTTSDPCNLAG